MPKPWSPEVAIPIKKARLLIEKQFPQINPIQISHFGEGFDNTVFNVNNQYVFRFPRREIAVSLLKIENHLLPKLIKELNIAIPEPIFFGKPSNEYNWPFTGYQLVHGDSPGLLSDETRDQSAESLAIFFRRLHQFPIEEAKELGVPYDSLERTNIVKRKAMLYEKLNKAVELQLITKEHIVFEWLKALKIKESNTKLTLVHGDCHIRNILVNERGIISGIIDWGDTHLGNPAIDLSIAYSFLSSKGRKNFFNIYGNVSLETRRLAQFFAVYISVVLILYGHDLHDEKLVTSALDSLRVSLN
ncbi:MAG: phosphotransferase [Bacillota bacterium]|nr:phosphotransferase [Bacillota bacterium]